MQGLTEFFPISSSAHLVLVPHFLKWAIPPLLFDVALHAGTLIAVLVFFWEDIIKLFTSDRRLFLLLLVACVPTGVIGFLFKGFFESLFENPKGVSALLLVTGLLLFIASRKQSTVHSPQSTAEEKNPSTVDRRLSTISFVDALWIGFAQGCAIAPGISRSGATISTGILRGISADQAARFSFLLSIPAILGALAFKIKDFNSQLSTLNPQLYLIGGIAASVSGYIAIKVVFKALKTNKFKFFAYYCWLVGIIGLILK